MTDDDFIDIESLDGQAELIRRTRAAIESIGPVQAESPDRLARVTVTISGQLIAVDLAEETAALDRRDLGRLIVATAHAASELAAARVTDAMHDVQQRHAEMLDEFAAIDPAAAAALRDVTANATDFPAVAPIAEDPLDYRVPDRLRTDDETDQPWS